MRCPLANEELAAVYQTDRNIGLPVKYFLIPATLLITGILKPRMLYHPTFLLGVFIFALGTGALHWGYRRWGSHERFLVLACGALESFYVILMAHVLRAPLEILVAIPTLKAVQLSQTVLDRLLASAVSLAVLLGGTAYWHPSRFSRMTFWWEVLTATVVVVSSLVICNCIRCRKCAACAANRMYGVLLHKLVNAQEEERRRIARDLHDSRSQDLTALIINLDLLQQTLPEEMARAHAQVERVKEMANNILEDVHNLIYELRPTLLDDLGLEPAIRWYVRYAIEPRGIHVELNAQGLEDRRYPPQLETAVFRIVQEALTNVVKYAQARTVRISLRHQGAVLKAEVADDGVGFDVKRVRDASSGKEAFGLLGMQERAMLLGGRFNIVSAPGQGTRIAAEFPVFNESHEVQTHLNLVGR